MCHGNCCGWCWCMFCMSLVGFLIYSIYKAWKDTDLKIWGYDIDFRYFFWYYGLGILNFAGIYWILLA